MSRTAVAWIVSCLGAATVFLAYGFVAFPDEMGLWTRLVHEVQSAQRSLHRELAATLQAVQEQGAAAALWLVTLSFAYGVLHAVGPGHGKVVITTYLITQGSRLGRGVLLSMLTSLFQGVTAVAAVGVGVVILGLSLRHTQSHADNLQLLSYALVAIAGLVIVVSRVRCLARWSMPDRSHDLQGNSMLAKGERAANGHTPHDDDTCCGHAHSPSAEQLDAPLSWRAIAGMAIAVGIRPCSGAIVVLLVAHSLKLHSAGIAAVLAMSLGTAMTVSVLAAVAVYARGFAIRLSTHLPGTGGMASVVLELLALLGGVAIFIMGALLFQAAWIVPVHPLR